MTRICEKFVEEISSGTKSVSEELKQHLAGCPDCQTALAASSSLKQARKPLSAKEAAAISGIIKAIKAESAVAASTAALSTGNGSAVIVKLIMAVTVVVGLIATTFSGNGISIRPDEKPISIPAIESPDTEISIADNDVITEKDTATSDECIDCNDESLQSIASETSDATEENASAETDITEVNTILVSPDQEELKPR